MPSYARPHAHSRTHRQREFLPREPTQDGDHAVMAAHWVKSKRPRGNPNAGDSQPTAANVADHHAAARYTVQLAQEYCSIVASKVVKELRAKHNVECAIRYRQLPRIRAHDRQGARVRGQCERFARVESDSEHRHTPPRRRRAHARGNVPQTGAYVEQGESGLWRCVPQKVIELREHRVGASKQRVRARHVTHRPLCDLRVDRRIIQILAAMTAARSEKRHLSARVGRIRRDSTRAARLSSPTRR
jgi:hypothetical protein